MNGTCPACGNITPEDAFCMMCGHILSYHIIQQKEQKEKLTNAREVYRKSAEKTEVERLSSIIASFAFVIIGICFLGLLELNPLTYPFAKPLAIIGCVTLILLAVIFVFVAIHCNSQCKQYYAKLDAVKRKLKEFE